MSTKRERPTATKSRRKVKANLGSMGHEHDDTREAEENQVASSQDHSDDDDRSIDSGEDRGDDAGILEDR
jgi:hypothetical protein